MSSNLAISANIRPQPFEMPPSHLHSLPLERDHRFDEALEVLMTLLDSQPDCLLIGDNLPDQDVVHLLTKLKNQLSATCCIFLTDPDQRQRLEQQYGLNLPGEYPHLKHIKGSDFVVRCMVNAHC